MNLQPGFLKPPCADAAPFSGLGARVARLRRGRLYRIALLVAVLLASAPPAHAYLWEDDVPVDGYADALRVADLSLPKILRLDWRYFPMGSATPVFSVRRVNGGTTTFLGTTTAHYWEDTTFDYGTSYQYQVAVTSDEDAANMGLPAPPEGANPNDIFVRHYASGDPWASINATPMKVDVTDNQTVDSRLDLRYALPVFKDFLFGSGTYRGGLFSGYGGDPSRVARSFLKFSLPSLPAGATLWTGTVNAYATRALSFGNTEIGCQAVSDVGWNPATLKWTSAPALDAGSPYGRATVIYNQDGTVSVDQYNGTRDGNWVAWPLYRDLYLAAAGSGALTAGLASTHENSSGWVYFSKKEYDSTQVPCVLYCYGSPNWIWDASVDMPTLYPGDTAIGTATLALCAPAGGAELTLIAASDPPDAVTVPYHVTVPAGEKSVQFIVTANQVQQPTQVLLDVAGLNSAQFVQLEVDP